MVTLQLAGTRRETDFHVTAHGGGVGPEGTTPSDNLDFTAPVARRRIGASLSSRVKPTELAMASLPLQTLAAIAWFLTGPRITLAQSPTTGSASGAECGTRSFAPSFGGVFRRSCFWQTHVLERMRG